MHPILVHIGDWKVGSYFVLLGLAAVVSLWYFRSFAGRLGLAAPGDFWLLANIIAVAGVLGGQLLAIGVNLLRGAGNGPLPALLASTEGPPTFGVLLGVLGGVYLFCRQRNADYRRTLDYVFLVVPVGHGIARLGCLLAGCCYGRPVQGHIAWAVVFTDPAAEVPPSLLGVPLHPTQLYEAAGDFAIAGALYFLLLPWVERSPARRGILCFAYFLAYGLLRFTDEFFRGDVIVQPSIGITTNQALALAAVVGSVSCAFMTARKTWRLSAAL